MYVLGVNKLSGLHYEIYLDSGLSARNVEGVNESITNSLDHECTCLCNLKLLMLSG